MKILLFDQFVVESAARLTPSASTKGPVELQKAFGIRCRGPTEKFTFSSFPIVLRRANSEASGAMALIKTTLWK